MMEGLKKLPELFLALFFVCIFVRDAESCQCYPIDPHEKFCHSDIVALVTVKDKDIVPKHADKIPDTEYLVEIIYLLRGVTSNNADLVKLPEERSSNYMKFYIPSYGSTCGLIILRIGETYLLSGVKRDNRVNVHLCGLNKVWSTVTQEERRDITQNYHKYCEPKVE